ncbi:MAG: 50S ribosomal protein L5 [Microgenomates group bacterium GW2011_GWA1_Microgenomates_45_10]|nr:MAG: 50S ribosomal protein L5 [Microgenomates group bacterium GW2011_GWA2_44_7]KKT78080.1 MAG: 50S ribosomal protein L5 [Microgenomates group bacterium GW2011_GWB1_44_8]KKT87417.1 MAG: 50S ribosomal protein L5 [Microgenomates group bacterium GW2011_GWA1_Microgenomates_45_10]
MTQISEKFTSEVLPVLMQELKLENPLAVPKIIKVVINVGTKEAASNKSVLEHVIADVTAIAGQKPRVNLAKKSIAGFKLREGDPIGVSCTLRGTRMDDFLQKFFHIVLPRVRDFRGISAAGFDGRGNLTIGLGEQIVFPEVDYTKIDKIRGMEITLVTSAKNDASSYRMLKLLGLPFKKDK